MPLVAMDNDPLSVDDDWKVTLPQTKHNPLDLFFVYARQQKLAEAEERLLSASEQEIITSRDDETSKATGDTVLHVAIKLKRQKWVNLLIKHTALLTVMNYEHDTPLDTALAQQDIPLAIVEQLLNAGSPISRHTIMRVLTQPRVDLIQIIIRNDQLFDAELTRHSNTMRGWLLFDSAHWASPHGITYALDKGGADYINDRDNNSGRTPLHTAVTAGCKECIALLLKHGANPLITDRQDKTALQLAQQAVRGLHPPLHMDMPEGEKIKEWYAPIITQLTQAEVEWRAKITVPAVQAPTFQIVSHCREIMQTLFYSVLRNGSLQQIKYLMGNPMLRDNTLMHRYGYIVETLDGIVIPSINSVNYNTYKNVSVTLKNLKEEGSFLPLEIVSERQDIEDIVNYLHQEYNIVRSSNIRRIETSVNVISIDQQHTMAENEGVMSAQLEMAESIARPAQSSIASSSSQTTPAPEVMVSSQAENAGNQISVSTEQIQQPQSSSTTSSEQPAIVISSTTNDETKIAAFKAVIATKDCQKIRDAVVGSWPKERVGFALVWFGNKLTFGAISLSATERVYGACVLKFVVEDILHPAMYGNADIAHAIEQIDILAGERSSKKYGIFGCKKIASDMSHALKIAICRARHIDPSTYHLIEKGDEEAHEIVAYVGKKTGEIPVTKTRLFSLFSYKTIGLGLAVVAVLGSIYYWFTNSDEQDDDTDADQEDMKVSNGEAV